MILVEKLNEVYIRLNSEEYIQREISDYFTFTVPNANFIRSKNKKLKRWKGQIRLFNHKTRTLYMGLLPHLIELCKRNQWPIQLNFAYNTQSFSEQDAKKFIETIKTTKIPRDYQLETFIDCVRNRRRLVLSPTSSGKSFMIYLLTRLYTFTKNSKALIIVPTTSLVHQMAGDFVDYGADPKTIYKIMAGVDKSVTSTIVISTWQSLYQLDQEWFNQFNVVIGDEAHLYKAESLTSIMTKLVNCKYRFGFTGTLDGMLCNQLVIEGLFGEVKKVITTKELMDRGDIADLSIKILSLKYSEQECEMVSNMDYPAEKSFLISNIQRNKFICDLALSLKGNTLILYQYVEKHGELLYTYLKNNKKDNVYFIHGDVDGEDREEIRRIVDTHDNSLTVASYGTFSTGVNIVNLDNVILASPSKSKVRILQSIGRSLRKSELKTKATLFDVADNLTFEGRPNTTLKHLVERVRIYNNEQFKYRVYDVELGRHN